ncbi:MAG: YidC/Oxa1 family membrane protein insertase [Candidatus Sungiibacteriota bacterium]
MNILYILYTEVLYRPLFNGLIFIYSVIPPHDLGLSIVILTILVRLILFPATLRAFRSQAAMRAIQPKLKAIQEEYKGDKGEQTKRIMALYAEHKMNPFSGCLPILIQLPALIALYQIFWKGIDPSQFEYLYSFIAEPEIFNTIAFGLVDLMKRSIPLALLAGVSQFFQARLMPQPEPPSPKSGRALEPDLSKILSLQVKYFFPLLIAVWSFSLPSALPLYWTTMNLLAIVEQILIKKKFQ